MTEANGLEPFADQSRGEHVLTVLGGVVVCLVAYVGTASLLFGLSVLDHGAPFGPRGAVTAIASLAVWGYYTGAFIRGKGGPLTDVLIYPTVTIALVPVAFRWLVFGPDWVGLRERFAFVIFRPGFILDIVIHVLPGVLFSGLLLALWASMLGEERIAAWQRRHLTPAFRAAFVEKEGDNGNEDGDPNDDRGG
ncbi:hypothetical protein [Halorubrum vacuolatum]|uniref:Uncharacterized protein n=1 Tax=Halorubrum vacuolatum TaxID=63740 RepID=A0A238X5F8_HALVU|nr:hypothetical protein [Halorubrum vacuolatum]SNR54246.1 hypothetical protein SAMN06264855_1143 [Halorubrum vacuolatum]